MVPRNPMASHDPTVPHDPDAAAGEPDRRAEPGPVDWDHLRAVTLADPALQRRFSDCSWDRAGTFSRP